MILWVGIAICLGFLLFTSPGGPAAVFREAAAQHKFSLGSGAMDFSQPTIPVLLIYGFFWYLQKFTADQTIIQRYLVAKTDRSALKGVALGSVLCVPVWSLFMLIGTCTWAFYRLTGEKLPAFVSKADQVFPYYLTTHLPSGIAGVVMAALMGAAMCALASDLNSFSAVGVQDIYGLLRPGATDRQRLRTGKYIVAGSGVACIGTALVLAQTSGSALSMWFTASAIASGGLAGLFLLAFVTSRATRRGVYAGICATLLFTAWASVTLPGKRIVDLGAFNFPWHDYMIGAIGHVILFIVGYLGSLVLPDKEAVDERLREMTLWNWIKSRRAVGAAHAAVRQ